MFFLIGFFWFVAGSFAFVLAILTPNWATYIIPGSITNTTVQRGIFYVCDLVSSDNTYQTTLCVSIIQQTSSTDPTQWVYSTTMACAALAIACAALSIITIWLSGIYFHVRQRTKKTSCFLLFLTLPVLTTFCTSFIVWILMISGITQLNVTINSQIFNWPMWLAVASTGCYLMSLISMIISFFTIRRRQNTLEQNYYTPKNQF